MDPFTIGFFVVSIALSVASFLMMPKAPESNPSTAGEFEAPVAKDGATIVRIFGTVDITGAIVAWQGDTSVQEIRKNG